MEAAGKRTQGQKKTAIRAGRVQDNHCTWKITANCEKKRNGCVIDKAPLAQADSLRIPGLCSIAMGVNGNEFCEYTHRQEISPVFSAFFTGFFTGMFDRSPASGTPALLPSKQGCFEDFGQTAQMRTPHGTEPSCSWVRGIQKKPCARAFREKKHQEGEGMFRHKFRSFCSERPDTPSHAVWLVYLVSVRKS
jgi:hypothetical protein